MAKAIESTDFTNPELTGLIDFSALSTGGLSITPIAVEEREFGTGAEAQAKYEAFMGEPVVIKIHSTSDKNEPLVADLALNGVRCVVPREKPVRLPRAFVEILARSQVRNYSQERVANPDATEGMVTKRHVGSSFPFMVLQDKNPKGQAWLRRVTHESA